jgi:pyruvate,water dikinase
MARTGIRVPHALCVYAGAYGAYVAATGLRERILLELSRKPFEDMRWEELWDAALRIRNLFLTTPIPEAIDRVLREAVEGSFGKKPCVVRSSAPEEDAQTTSFAGLHDSYVNVRGAESVLEHIRLVWASLWSDRAMLYRRELGLDVERSTMAVLVQEIVAGDCSGVVFGRNPADPSEAVIESVYGLNQGLVDGAVEPDRWTCDRESGEIRSHTAPRREKAMVPAPEGVRLESLSPDRVHVPPLDSGKVKRVYRLARETETLFGRPQDVEWTFRGDVLYALQSRAITTAPPGEALPGADDRRPWYLSLQRSFDNLKVLRRRIEEQWIPSMEREVEGLADRDPSRLSDRDLAGEIDRRERLYRKWADVYWSEFIPFAHGARLFGQLYNDTVHPEDPYEFTDLLGASEMLSLQRNRLLEAMAGRIREDPGLAEWLRRRREKEGGRREAVLPARAASEEAVPAGGRPEAVAARSDSAQRFGEELDVFLDRFGDLTAVVAKSGGSREAMVDLLLEMAECAPAGERFRSEDMAARTRAFLDRFEGERRTFAAELLDLARSSYRLRDDDNIHLGRIEARLREAVEEGKRRVRGRGAGRGAGREAGRGAGRGAGQRAGRGAEWAEGLSPPDLGRALVDPDFVPEPVPVKGEGEARAVVRARQLVGQPAGPGIARGRARVIGDPADLFAFKAGEILVCDAVDPNMTFVVPLCRAVVERRGGMLIHGAIIAREYGLPCVTGVPDATALIRTGDPITVDGYLGIVVLGGTGANAAGEPDFTSPPDETV